MAECPVCKNRANDMRYEPNIAFAIQASGLR